MRHSESSTLVRKSGEEREQSPYFNSVSHVSEKMTGLHEIISSLSDKLHPVLREGNLNKESEVEKGDSSEVPIEHFLEELIFRLETAKDRLGNMIERCVL